MTVGFLRAVHAVSGDGGGPQKADLRRLALGTQRGLAAPICPARHAGSHSSLPSSVAADAELPGVHVPRPGPGEGVQHEPHHAQTLAGKIRRAANVDAPAFPVGGPDGVISVSQLAIQENYRNNPFHNFRHCFCVSQMMYGMIHLCNLQVGGMLPLQS